MNAAGIAWNQLLHKLKRTGSIPATQLGVKDLPESSALFVTWTLDEDLRGCIGTFAPGPSEATIREYAEIAAFQDPRFDPIDVSELSGLSATVTILGELEPCGLTEWTVGEHGVRAEFCGRYSATFLPEVALEQGWDHSETLRQLARKAGAPSTRQAKLWRYPGTKHCMGYQQYRAITGI